MEIRADYVAECRALEASHQNVLIEGPEMTATGVLDSLLPHLLEPILWNDAGVPPQFVAGQPGTLILRDVGNISAEDQNRLLQSLEDSRSRIQIVSVTGAPLFPLVAQGRFNANLYYRLNTILVRTEFALVQAVYAPGTTVPSWANDQAS